MPSQLLLGMRDCRVECVWHCLFHFFWHNRDGRFSTLVTNRPTRREMGYDKCKHNRSDQSHDSHSPDVTPSLQVLIRFFAKIGFSILAS